MRRATCSSSRLNEQYKYLEVLNEIRSDVKLVDLGANIRIIRRTRTGAMILELKRNKERKGAVCKSLAEEVLGEGVEVRVIKAEATLKMKNPEEIIHAEELVTAPWQQCEVQVATAAVRLRKGPARSQVQLPVAEANKSVV